jgi:uncharacterized protein YjbJ (UPF0337 family)
MKNRDELEGKAKALKDKIKQAAGDVTNNPRLHDEGVVDEVVGKARRESTLLLDEDRPC